MCEVHCSIVFPCVGRWDILRFMEKLFHKETKEGTEFEEIHRLKQ